MANIEEARRGLRCQDKMLKPYWYYSYPFFGQMDQSNKLSIFIWQTKNGQKAFASKLSKTKLIIYNKYQTYKRNRTQFLTITIALNTGINEKPIANIQIWFLEIEHGSKLNMNYKSKSPEI